MSIRNYFLKFYKNLELMEGKKPSIYDLFKHSIKGFIDYCIYGSTITDYFELTFWNKTHKEKSAYVTWRFHKQFIYKVDNPKVIEKFSSKDAMYSRLQQYVNRKQLDTNICTYDDFSKFIHDVPRFLYKPYTSSCGNGIKIIDSSNLNARELFEKIKKLPSGILDELIVQHHVLNELNPSSVNTLRIFTFRTNDTIYFTGAVLRVGTISFIDNYSAGGLVLSIDLKTGIANHPAENYVGERFKVHPITGATLEGVQIPNWHHALDFIYKAAKEYDLNYVAWDLAIRENDFVLVEANPAGMINVIQIAGAGGKMSLYKILYKRWRDNPYKEDSNKSRKFKRCFSNIGSPKIIKKEIGSEFWDVPICGEANNMFPCNTKWFISGTAALEFILLEIKKNKDVKTAAIPSWCCSCMISPFLKNDIKVKFYSVYLDEEKNLVCDYSEVGECDIYLIISYFGYTSQRNIGKLSGIVIRDMTHSIFCKKYYDGDYYFGSLRKWAGFWTGGYAWSKSDWNKGISVPSIDKNYVNLRKEAMEDKKEYILGNNNCKKYLEIFETAEKYLDNCNIVSGHSRDIEFAKSMNIAFIREKRRENAKELLKYLKDIAIFPKVDIDDCPLFVPIILPMEKRDALREFLISHDIYCPIHWPVSDLHKLNKQTVKLYENELSIVCDQRYTTEDMRRIAETIKRFEFDSK